MNRSKNLILVIFGASGDLTKRKLVPGLFNLYCQNLLPASFCILGVSRSSMDDANFRLKMDESIVEFNKLNGHNREKRDAFLKNLFYTAIDTSDPADYQKIKDRLDVLDTTYQTGGNFIYYLSTPPVLYGIIPKNLHSLGLTEEKNGAFKRLVVEKPFGTSLETARELNQKLLGYVNEHQIYRIDHYLGKETVQNLLVTRFANGIFEPLWNRNFVERVEITSAESLGVEGRGGYYEHSGALRDMLQNHLLQLTGLIAMEPPSEINADAIRNEVLKVFQAFRPLTEEDVVKNIVRGQYIESKIRGVHTVGYRQEEGVDPQSRTETFVALKFYIDNWRWGGVPFYIRTGKMLPTRVTEVVVHFKKTPHALFKNHDGINTNNQMVVRIQPDEGILLKFGLKVPGAGFNVQQVNMDFHYEDLQHNHLPDAYERLLLDCMQGDATLFTRGDAIEAAWEFVDPILKNWQDNPKVPMHGYPAGTWGPNVADNLIEGSDTSWRYPCKNLSNDGNYCEL
jgi:glucose-6-phosphate 1-dehydrogenase